MNGVALPLETVTDVRSFWRAVGQRAVGAAIVTAADAEGAAGFLALSATHLSAEPPCLMVSIDSRTSALRQVLSARHFAVNYLPRGAESLADTFGGKGALKGAARFAAGAWTTLVTGAPILVSAVGAFDCTLDETIERHGAVLAIGRLVGFTSNPQMEPLIAFRGGYR
jgi:flavin reductase (DIM6/NTAB) family NADH-FMN oxidoreductase RutF